MIGTTISIQANGRVFQGYLARARQPTPQMPPQVYEKLQNTTRSAVRVVSLRFLYPPNRPTFAPPESAGV